jgi:hypothetical protein
MSGKLWQGRGVIEFPVKSDAVVSSDGRFRYVLSRRWSTEPSLVFCMLNPSTADAENDDPTIRRCMYFAEREGAGGLVVVNLFAYRTKSPDLLAAQNFPVGVENDWRIADAARGRQVVAAWGAHARKGIAKGRAAIVLKMLHEVAESVHYLDITRDGLPRHPLYVRNDSPLERMYP